MPAIAFGLPDEVATTCDGIADFAEREVLPRHRRHADVFDDPRRRFRDDGRLADEVVQEIREVRMAAAAEGFFTMCVPEGLGGGGLGHLAYYAAWQRLFHRCGPRNWLMLYVLSHWAFGPSRLLERMSGEARERVLPGLMDGSRSMCFGLTEPGAGSDASRLATTAVRDGDGWRIDGGKIYTSNGALADYCVVFAVTDAAARDAGRGGITAFLVPTAAEGFEVVRVLRLFGQLGSDEVELRFEGVRAEPWQVVGEEHQGFRAALYGVSLGRVYNSARAVGYGRWAVERALAYAAEREAFGTTISEFQGVSFPLADSATELHAAHLMGLNAATLLDRGEPAVKELSMTKAYSVQAGLRAVDRAIQTHGGRGFLSELGLTEAWQALRVVNVADGTNEILARTIARRLFAGDTDL
ncbi:MAG: acyl-CoA dehydrogenase [Thermoanaerobaculia bacterium]|nr:acyl-CoA dehydrogenase [Thermoanaerobaculia bacterium]